MKRISSTTNPAVKEARSLLKRKYRDKLGLYLVEGEKMVREILDADLAVRVFAQESKADKLAGLLSYAQDERKVETIILSDECFHSLEATVMSQGMVAVAIQNRPSDDEWRRLLDSEPVNVLVIDEVQDPGNIGALIRTAVAAEYKAIILTKGTADPYSPKVTRATTGLNRLPFIKMVDSPSEAIEWLRANGKKIMVADARGDLPYYESSLVKDIALVLGNEGSGMAKEFIDEADEVVYIPMLRDAESLNVAVAGGILMYKTVERKARCRNKMQK